MGTKQIKLYFIIFIITLSFSTYLKSQNIPFDTTRIYKVMEKARIGGDISIGVFGGSITAGTWASTPDKRWANLVTDWWKEKFPKAKFKLVNAGFGGTGTDIGTFRVQNELLKYNPDFVVVEFAVNDAGRDSTYAKEMMEGIVRQILQDSAHSAILMLMLKMEDGKNEQVYHKEIANYYHLPIVSEVDSIDALVAKDGLKLHDIYKDGVHPNDIGMKYITSLITNKLNSILLNLPVENKLPKIDNILPKPLVTDLYTKTSTYNGANIPSVSKTDWTFENNSWTSSKPGAEFIFPFNGQSVGLTYSQFKDTIRGIADVWVDNLPAKKLNAYWTETWGKGTSMCMVAENLPNGPHMLHIKITNENSTGSKGHLFEFFSIMKAGE
jgi:lysophospholipase L1-like esterase